MLHQNYTLSRNSNIPRSEQAFLLQLIAMSENIKVAAVNAEPVWGDLQGSVKKVVELILEAANKGTKVFGLPQSFVPGYP